jgi:hypothetical protein
MRTLKPFVALSVCLLFAGALFAQDASVSFRTGSPTAGWCPIEDLNGDPLADGCYIGLYSVGADMMVDPPNPDGSPGGDDFQFLTNTIGNGMDHLELGFGEGPFVPDGNLFIGNGSVLIPPAGGGTEPVWNQGDTGYLRAFNGVTPDVAVSYNDLYTVDLLVQNYYLPTSPGPVTVEVCFDDAVELIVTCEPLEVGGPEGPVTIDAGNAHYFFQNECTLWITALTSTVYVTSAQLFDAEPMCEPFPATNYMTRYFDLTGDPTGPDFQINFGYSQADYDASDFGPDESLLHVAWYDGDPEMCDGVWRKVDPTVVNDTPEGGDAMVVTDHFSHWSFGWDGGDTQLPVELVSFQALASDRAVVLEWVTESETNNRGFFIERSTDNESFTRVSQEIEATNSATGAEYSYTDGRLNNGVTYYYRLIDVDINGVEYIHEEIVNATPSFLGEAVVITEYKLHHNYPNPFNPSTNIVYDVLENGHVTLKVYNVMGQEVASLVNDARNMGRYAVAFDATGLSSGIYFYSVKVNNFSDTKKMLLVQ